MNLLKIVLLSVSTIYLTTTVKSQTNSQKEVQDTITDIEEIIISASRTPEVKNKAAAAIQIIDKKQIEEISNINPDVTAILGFLVPGMAMQSNTVSNRSQTLRGRTPLLLINGVPQSTPLRLSSRDLRSIDPSAIERIEIIKGATSIYGNGASGGIINLITKKNNSEAAFGGSTSLSFTTHPQANDLFKNEGGAGYSVIQEFNGSKNNWDYLVNASLRRTGILIDGTGDYISPRYGLGEMDTYNVYAHVGYHLNRDSRIELTYNYYRSLQDPTLRPENGTYLSTPTIGVPGEREGVYEGTPYNHNVSLTYHNPHLFSNTSLQTSIFYQNLYTIYDYRTPPRWNTGGQATIRGVKYGLRASLESLLRWNSVINSQFTYGIDGLIDLTSQPLVDGRLWVPELQGNTIAPFLQTKQTIYDHFIWKAGVRYDLITVNVPDYETVPNSGEPTFVHGGQLRYSKPTFNTGLTYTRFKQFQPFIAFSQGMSIYDLGRVLRSASRDDVANIMTDPVLTNNYEFGFNSNIRKNLDVSASLFRNDSKLGADLILQDGFWIVERNPQYVWGWDIAADYKPTKQITIGGSFGMQKGWSDSEGTGNYDKPLSGLLIAPSKLDLHSTVQPIDKLSFSIFYIRTGARDVFSPQSGGQYAEGEGPVKPINIWNLNANYHLSKKISCSLSMENIFNKTYYTQIAMLNARDAEYTRGNGNYTTLRLRYAY